MNIFFLLFSNLKKKESIIKYFYHMYTHKNNNWFCADEFNREKYIDLCPFEKYKIKCSEFDCYVPKEIIPCFEIWHVITWLWLRLNQFQKWFLCRIVCTSAYFFSFLKHHFFSLHFFIVCMLHIKLISNTWWKLIWFADIVRCLIFSQNKCIFNWL